MYSYSSEVNFFGHNSPFELIAAYGSPLYVYNENILRKCCRDLRALSPHPNVFVNYSAKANSNPSLLKIIREEGCVVDAMSPGELYINKLAGFTAEEILYVCNNVSGDELRNAIDNNVLISVDSLSQLDLYGSINPGSKIMVRINPGIGAGHHQKVITAGKKTKFGVLPEDFAELCTILNKHNLTLCGLNQHIGSLFMEPEGYLEAVDFMLDFVSQMPKNMQSKLEVIDFGGGFGIPYHKQEGQARLNLEILSQGFNKRINEFCAHSGYQGKFFIEPGRYIVAESAILLGTVQAVKNNNNIRYVGSDIGFNMLMRPAMYDAHHEVEVYAHDKREHKEFIVQTVVGNICESGDILAKDRKLPIIFEHDILGVLDAGAYGYAMSSSYNQRFRPAEVLINASGKASLIRRRETIDDIVKLFL